MDDDNHDERYSLYPVSQWQKLSTSIRGGHVPSDPHVQNQISIPAYIIIWPNVRYPFLDTAHTSLSLKGDVNRKLVKYGKCLYLSSWATNHKTMKCHQNDYLLNPYLHATVQQD